MRKIVFIALFGILLSLITESLFAQWVDLAASVNQNRIELIWTTNEWPRDLMGFNIKKREVGQLDWTLLNASPILPEIMLNKNWSNLGMNLTQEQEVKGKLSTYLKEGKINEIGTENLLVLFRQNGGMQAGDRINLKQDFDMALMTSFGYIDNQYKHGVNLEYGLFFVDLNGTEKPVSIDTYKLSDAEFELNVSFQRPDQGVQVHISAAKERISKSGLWAFNVYKQDRKEATLVDKISYASFHEKNGLLEWSLTDNSADNTKNQMYIIAPVNTLQKETQRVTKTYEASLYEPIPAPEVTSISLVDAINLKVSWKAALSKKQLERIKNITIERLGPSDNSFKAINENLTPSVTEYVDGGIKLADKMYTYRVALVDTKGNYWYSQQSSINYQGKLLPAKPTNVRATSERIELTNYIVLTWDKAPVQDTVTYGYTIYTDEQQKGTFLLESNPTIRTNIYRHKVYGPEGRTYSFRVVALNKELDEGAFAEVTFFLAKSRLPEVENMTFETLPDKSIRIKWQYPPLDGLLGFRVLMNGKPIGTGDTLRTEQKSFIVTHPVAIENEMARFQVLAISKSGIGRSPERSVLVSERKGEKIIPAPTGLALKVVREKGIQYAQLTWDKVDQAALGIKGYVFFVDAEKEGDIQRQKEIDIINGNTYRYELPDKKRQKYTFRIGAMGQDRTIASFSEISLDKSKKQNSEDK